MDEKQDHYDLLRKIKERTTIQFHPGKSGNSGLVLLKNAVKNILQ